MRTRFRGPALLALAGSTMALACAGDAIRRFPLREPIWVVGDAPLSVTPAERASCEYGVAVDDIFLRPLSSTLALPIPGESLDVNSMDEVPNSAWFTNRIGFFPMPPDE